MLGDSGCFQIGQCLHRPLLTFHASPQATRFVSGMLPEPGPLQPVWDEGTVDEMCFSSITVLPARTGSAAG